MSKERRKGPQGDLEKIYRWNRNLATARARLLSLIYCQGPQSTTLDQNRQARIDRLEGRITRLTLMRNDELLRVYSSALLRRRLAALPESSHDSSRQEESRSKDPSLEVTIVSLTDALVTFEMLLPSAQPSVDEEKIVYPEGVTNRRPYQTIARYRQMCGQPTDFIAHPLEVGFQYTETLVLGLEKFAEDHACQLKFSNEDQPFDESLSRAAWGEVDLGSAHLLATDSLLTAEFQFKVNRHFNEDLAQSDETLRTFVKEFCQAIAEVLSCETNDVRVFSIQRMDEEQTASEVRVGLTTSTWERTEALAQDLQVDFDQRSNQHFPLSLV